MPNPVFPTLALTNGGQDSKVYNVEQEDPALKSDLEGGYVVSRAKHTRKPRKTFTTGYRAVSDADRKMLQNFYDTVRGGAVIFDWTDPVDGIVYQVRFVEKLQWKYVGIGEAKLWDVQFRVQQA